MSAPQTQGFSLKRATGVSVALHIVAAACLIVSPQAHERSIGTGAGAANEAVVVSRITIELRPHHVATNARPAARPTHARRMVSQTTSKAIVATKPSRYAKSATTVARATRENPAARHARTTVIADIEAANGPSSERVADASLANANASSETAGGAGAASATAVPEKLAVPIVAPIASPTASATPAAVALVQSPSRSDVPNGGWGQSAKPLVEDDAELATLRASVRSSATATIEVDESGRATHVSLPISLGSDVRAEVEKKLLGMRYVPAECNGLRCTGTLQVTI